MPKVTLTFDNGPTPAVTQSVLDCLSRHGVSSTFFVIGSKAVTSQGAALVSRASSEGHFIGNHTFTHTTPLGELERDAAVREFERAEEVLADLHQPRRLFRPFGRAGRLGQHLLHPAVIEKLQAGRYSCVLWNCVPGDWRDPHGWMPRALEGCRSRPWTLVVLHDLPTGAMTHLDEFIRTLRQEGMELTQDYPPECVPLVDGQIVQPLDQYVADVPL